MISFKYKEEKDILLHYAKVLDDSEAEKIITQGFAADKDDARILTRFYWLMVDTAVVDQGKGVPVIEQEGVEAWMEYIFHSLNGYMVSGGYEFEWDSYL